MNAILLSVLLSSFIVVLVPAQPDSCITYEGTNGTCINIKQCPSLLRVLRSEKPLSKSTLQRLNQSRCGFDGLDPKVCCSSVPSDIEEPQPAESSDSTAEVTDTMNNVPKEAKCQTANGNEGTCKSVEQCPLLYSVLTRQTLVSESTLRILRQSICGFEKTVPKVCCDNRDNPTTESAPPTIQSNQLDPSHSIPVPDMCVTPQGTDGTCVNIKRCKPLFEILKHSNQWSQELSHTLKELHCGFEGMDPKVCCENEQSNQLPLQDQPRNEQAVPRPPDVTNHPSLGLLDHDLCGPITEAKIMGGTKTTLFEFPWMALIAYDTGSGLPEFRCSGVLITKNHVLTAAHCVTTLPPELRLAGVRLGEHDLSTERDCDTDVLNSVEINCADDYQDFNILAVAAYPDYPRTNHQDDIGLIMLDGEANFDAANVRPICLPIGAQTLLNPKMTVTGWGATESGPRSETLLKVTLPVVPHEECAKLYKKRNIQIWHKQMCAGGSNQSDSCSGDSGGPLQTLGLYNGQPRNILYGIVSFGPRDCGMEGVPGVYTKVEYYMDWILDTIGEDILTD